MPAHEKDGKIEILMTPEMAEELTRGREDGENDG